MNWHVAHYSVPLPCEQRTCECVQSTNENEAIYTDRGGVVRALSKCLFDGCDEAMGHTPVF
jgi:hypothetical protein